ncbi:MAG TPA: DUF4349 domain-containing protein [Patescibacteria group bacterium]|nr:DUF4349 domain-containing protein [Patescibacteria group bacterium]
MAIVSWVKKNKLAAALLVIFLYLFLKSFLGSFFGGNYYSMSSSPQSVGMSRSLDFSLPSLTPSKEYSSSTASERMVVQETTLSLLVKNVSTSIDQAKKYAEKLGGYMVSATLSDPQDAARGNLTVRIPQDNLDDALKYFRSLGVRVVSEQLIGYDITDQYTDTEARLETLYKTKAKMEELLERAVRVEDMLQVQKELITLQAQIDQLKGQELYLKQASETSKITLYFSTDELALPYAPEQPWRPQVIFKHAVRSLVATLRTLGTMLIWIGVYAVLWIPLLGGVLLVRRKLKKKTP